MFTRTSLLTLALLATIHPSPFARGQEINSSALLNATAVVTGNFGVTGTFNFLAPEGSEEVTVTLSVSGLDALNSTADFLYHVHTNPVPSDGNCTKTLAHLDPLAVTEQIPCDPLQPQFCQEGDLSGKFGKLPGSQASPYTQTYQDPFLRFYPQPFSILGRSITVHFPNKTRIACGNITSYLDGTADEYGNPTGQSSTYVTDYAAVAPAVVSGAVTLTPFASGTTDPVIAAQATLPASLPDVDEVPNVLLSTATTLTTINGSSFSTAFPVAVAETSTFTYSGQGISALPTQSVEIVTSAPASSSGSQSGSATGSMPASTTTGTGTGAAGSLKVSSALVLAAGALVGALLA